MFKEATPEERRIYYREEWKPGDVPDFLAESIGYREFGFDHDGRGPRDRYNAFTSVEGLEKFLRNRAPYSAYSSVSYYEKPGKREGYMKAELVFDIDAKDLPNYMKKCCKQGSICEICLETAKQYILSLKDIFQGDFGVKKIYYIYSGRGFHMRILDPDVMEFTDVERAYILDYLSGSQALEGSAKVNRWLAPRGYTRIFKDRLLGILEDASVKDIQRIEGIGSTTAKEIIRNRDKIISDIREWKNLEWSPDPKTGIIRTARFKALLSILKENKYDKFTDFVLKQNAGILDAKVTVDTKRILRLPSSLHSKVSLKCMLIRDIESFEPLSKAVPKFVSERKG